MAMIRLCAFADEAGEALDTQIAALQKNHISLIEVRGVNGKNVADLTDDEARAAYRALRAAGITVWSVGSPLGKVPLQEAQAHLDRVRRVCEIARLLHAERVRVFSFFESEGRGAEVKSYLARMCEIAGEHGVVFCHENEKEIYGDTLPHVLELVQAEIKGLQFVFDPANYVQCGVDTAAALEALFDQSAYFHIKDVIAATGQLVPAGCGDGSVPKMIEMIAASGRDAVLTLEPHLKVFAGYGEIDNTEMQTKYAYKTNEESFAAAADALKALLVACGYSEIKKEGEWIWKKA
ncbi:MAG: sugar phosphate isomerase/epimerase [Clostridia bacterium]|nr:sugar phosphate isomerase/epimerase [Clostridia bacterium]